MYFFNFILFTLLQILTKNISCAKNGVILVLEAGHNITNKSLLTKSTLQL